MHYSSHGLNLEISNPAVFDEVASGPISTYSGPLDTVIDLGAHQGSFSLLAAKKGARRVFAFEPDPGNFRILLDNIADNGFSGLIFPIPLAIGPATGEAQLSRAEADGQISYMFDAAKYPPYITVPIFPFEALGLLLSPGGQIDYLKIDTEGAEFTFLTPEYDLILDSTGFLDLEIHHLYNTTYFPEVSDTPHFPDPATAHLDLQNNLHLLGFRDIPQNVLIKHVASRNHNFAN